MKRRLGRENPVISGNSARKSAASRATTFVPQPSACWRWRITRPMSQYSAINSRFTDSAAFTCAVRTRDFKSTSNAP